jgi:hypothetical protein
LSDNEKYASDTEDLPKGAARPSSTTVDARPTEGDAVEEGTDEAGDGRIETESEDEDPAATRRYWEVKRKKEGVHKVCIMSRDL